jgi:hypothetical protein
MGKLFHWLGHILFDMDCAVHVQDQTQWLYCKKCGPDVSMRKAREFKTIYRKPIDAARRENKP